MSRRKTVLILCLLCMVLSSCSNTHDVVEETAAPTLQVMETEDTVTFTPITEPTAIAEAPAEPEPVAERISEGLKVLIDGENFVKYLSDGSFRTSRTISKRQQLALESETPFSGVYFEWDSIPGIYHIVWENGSLECGHNEFIHEYVRLPESVTQATIHFQNEETHRLMDVEVFTEGSPPNDVQAWQPPCEEADILVFPTHSDDDALFLVR